MTLIDKSRIFYDLRVEIIFEFIFAVDFNRNGDLLFLLFFKVFLE